MCLILTTGEIQDSKKYLQKILTHNILKYLCQVCFMFRILFELSL